MSRIWRGTSKIHPIVSVSWPAVSSKIADVPLGASAFTRGTLPLSCIPAAVFTTAKPLSGSFLLAADEALSVDMTATTDW